MLVSQSKFEFFLNLPTSTPPIFHTRYTSNYLFNIIKIKFENKYTTY